MTRCDKALFLAFEEYERRDTDRILEETETIELPDFSRSFKNKIKAIIYGKNRKRAKIWKPLLVAAILIVLLMGTALAVTPVREAFRDFFIETFREGSTVEYRDNKAEGFLRGTFDYVPEGFEQTKEEYAKYLYYEVQYTNKDGDLIDCITFPNEESISAYNTEGIELQEIEVNGIPGVYYENLGIRNIIWVTGEYNNTITAPDSVSYEDLLKMAESRRKMPWHQVVKVFFKQSAS